MIGKEVNPTYKSITESIFKYGSTPEDAFRGAIPCSPDLIRDFVVIAPYWRPAMFLDSFDDIRTFAEDKVWEITAGDIKFTYIRTGIGAPRTGDMTLALGLTGCRKALFIGSAGALSPEPNIGDLVIPEFSVAGDGYSRYLTDGNLKGNDCFASKAYPDATLNGLLKDTVRNLTCDYDVDVHDGRVFSIDTVFAQFGHIDEITGYGCNCIEMETAVFFKSAEIAGIRAAALLQVSDNTVNNKSLYSGRTEEDQYRRKSIRKEFFPRVIMDLAVD